MKAYLTIGMPASGKTTWAEQQKEFININLDDCRAEVCGDAGNHSATPEAVILHDQKIRQAAANGLNIIISDTNLNQKYRDILVQKLIDLSYQVEYYLFPVSLDLAKERNSKRVRIVPENIIEAMFKSYQETTLSGKILLGATFISSDLIPELTQLANLEILHPSTDIQNLTRELLSLDLVALAGSQWTKGSQLDSWLQSRGLLQLNLTPYLDLNLEEILAEEFKIWPSEITLTSLARLSSKIFSYPLGMDKQLAISSDLMQNKSLLKTCFDENGQLSNSVKLAEIIKEIIK